MKYFSSIPIFLVFIVLILITLGNGCATKKDLVRIEERLEERDQVILDLQKDSDADGVVDFLDVEPSSPPEAKVDTNGMTLDSDGDGIPDYLDDCPFVQGPQSSNGCAPDNTVDIAPLPKRDDEFWPIPKPTSFATVTGNFYNLSKENTLEDVYLEIQATIRKKNKRFNKIMYVPEGFALFTKLEKIDNIGFPTKNPINIESGGCSISQIIYCLFGAPSGRYRFFAFIVSSVSEIESAIGNAEYSEIVKLISYGQNYNTSYVKTYDDKAIYFDGYEVHLIVYEYETFPGGLPRLVTESKIDHFKYIF